ncbi:hypothetical protein [Rhizobium sp. CNPSo 4039]|uniref:hypothetical protein n=1 Tax=Rhizobium sp. CNPSo 4039 TaxID=3021409 RepID=UPI00254CCB82|nr:hypothetical protein [Rhizobium sp. CNPSo 4039]MDK4714676.1 hypothetical protein [Rhizobium sp. CNPSo 4039]
MSDIDLRRIVEKSVAGGQTLMTTLEEVRKRIVLKRYSITKIQQAPASPNEALQRLNEWIETTTAGSAVENLAARFVAPGYRQPTSGVPTEIIAAAIAGPLRELIGGAISKSYGSAKGISAADRARELAKAEGELLEFECAEEAIIRHAEQCGIDVLRRIDADPRAVLCSGEFLK